MPTDAIFSNYLTDQALTPQMTDLAMNNAFNQAASGAFGDVSKDAILNSGLNAPGVGEAIMPAAGNVAKDGTGFFADKGNVNMLNLGLKGLGLANTMRGTDEALRASRQNRQLAKSAYDRNVSADERRQKLNF